MNRTIIFMHVFAFISCVSSLGAMNPEWPPSPERVQQEMSQPYVKAGIQEMQQEVAREMWARPGNDRTKLIRIYKQSTEFQAVIGKMQENLGLTDDLIIEHVKEMGKKLGRMKINASTSSQWMPILNYAYPRLSQLMLAKARIYTDNDFDTLVRIVRITSVEESDPNIAKKRNELSQIENRISKIEKELGWGITLNISFKPQDDIYGFLSIILRRDFTNRLLFNYVIKRQFGEGERNLYSDLISAITTSNFARKFCEPPLAKISTSLRNKLQDTFIAAMFRDAADRNGLVLLFNQENRNKSVELINDITDPDLKNKTKEFVRSKAISQCVVLPNF